MIDKTTRVPGSPLIDDRSSFPLVTLYGRAEIGNVTVIVRRLPADTRSSDRWARTWVREVIDRRRARVTPGGGS